MRVCSKCHKRKKDTSFYKDVRYENRRVTICKLCMKDRSKEREYNFRPMRKRSSYREAAERRGIPFELSKEEFMTFWKKSCVYCGDRIETIGVDRVNNDLGYVAGNVVPCCSVCNSMKGKRSYDEFIAHCKKILSHLQTRGLQGQSREVRMPFIKKRSTELDNLSAFSWGCRSAIQKAIRRSDGPLMEQCFKDIWETDKQFLLRRTLIYAAEECWPLLSEVFTWVQESRGFFKKGAGPMAQRKGMALIRAACRKMTMAEKSKDAASLASLVYGNYGAINCKTDLDTKQLTAMTKFYHACNKAGGEKRVWAILHCKADEAGTEYAKEMVRACHYGFSMRGMPNEQWKFLAAAIMVVSEYNELPVVHYATKISFVPSTKRLPLFVYDQHTRTGRTAIHRVARDIGMSYDKLAMLWFNKVSAVVDRQREGERWWPLRMSIVDASITDKRWAEIEKEVFHEIQNRLREEALS